MWRLTRRLGPRRVTGVWAALRCKHKAAEACGRRASAFIILRFLAMRTIDPYYPQRCTYTARGPLSAAAFLLLTARDHHV